MKVRIVQPSDPTQVDVGDIEVKGTYRNQFGKEIALFHRAGHRFWPQGKPAFSGGGRWTGTVNVGPSDGAHSIVVAEVSPEIQILIDYYFHVCDRCGEGIGINMANLPPGLRILHQVDIYLK